MLVSLLVIAVAAAPQTSAASLAHAVELFNDLQPDQAAVEFRKLLEGHPKTSEAARAHLYLGIIAFDALDIDTARKEFREALVLNPAIELPFNSSPKAMVTLRQVRNGMGQESAPAAPGETDAATPPAALNVVPLVLPLPAGGEVAQTQPARPIPASFWVTLGIGAGAAIAGGVVGALSQGPASSAASAPDVASATTYLNQATNERIAADGCYGAAIVAGVVATVLLFTRGSVETPSPAAAGAP